MKNKIYSFKNGSDSAIMYHKKLPKYLTFTLIIILALFIGFVFWSVYTKKSEVAEIQGTFEVDDKTYIMPAVTSTIKNVYVENGQFVSVGEKLFGLDDADVSAKIILCNKTIKGLNDRKHMFEILIDSIQNEAEIPFSTDYSELEFYNYYQTFLSQTELYSGSQREEYKRQTENTYLNEIASLAEKISQYESELEIYKDTQKKYVICAESEGVVSLNGTFSVGSMVSAGTNIGSIINQNDDLYLNGYAEINDRSKLVKGQSVDLAVLGVSQSKYGLIKGKVTFISEDTIKSESGAFYLVKIEIEQRYIASEDDRIDLVVGMGAEARVIYKTTSYFDYFLEQIGIK